MPAITSCVLVVQGATPLMEMPPAAVWPGPQQAESVEPRTTIAPRSGPSNTSTRRTSETLSTAGHGSAVTTGSVPEQLPAAHVFVRTSLVTKFLLPSVFPPVLGQVTGVTTPFLSISSLMIVATSFVCAQSEPVTGVPPHVTVESWICTSLPTSILNLPCLKVQAL